jgi:hypothetical protein
MPKGRLGGLYAQAINDSKFDHSNQIGLEPESTAAGGYLTGQDSCFPDRVVSCQFSAFSNLFLIYPKKSVFTQTTQ